MTSLSILCADPIMRTLVEKYDPPKIGMTPIFTSLTRAIISQQLSEAAASTIFTRLKNLSAIEPYELLNIDIESYRSCGISRAKASYIQSVSQAALDGHIDNIDTLPDDEAIKALTKLKGVGRWTAEMILIFALGREDVWPTDDAGLLRAAKMLYDTQSIDDFIRLGERFQPYRSHVAWYLWCSLAHK